MDNNCELDVVSGEVVHTVTDVYVPSLVSLALTRRYVSSSRANGLLGWAWLHNYTPSLGISKDSLTKYNPIDGDRHFPHSSCDGKKGPTYGILRHGARDDGDFASLRLASHIERVREQDVLVLNYPNGSQELYCHDQSGGSEWRLLAYQDPDGNALLYQYHGFNLTGIVTPEGVMVRLEYAIAGLLSRLVVLETEHSRKPLLQIDCHYDSNQDLIAVTNLTGRTWRYQYEGHLLVRSIDYEGFGKNYIYDADRRCVGTWSDGARHVRLVAHDVRRHTILLTETYGRRTLLRCNDAGTIVTHVDAKGQTTENLLGSNGGIVGNVDATGQIAQTYSLDPETRVLSESFAVGGAFKTQLDANGRMIQSTNPSGHVRKHTYDAQGRRTELILPNEGVVRNRYDRRGALCSLTDPLGYEIRREESSDRRALIVSDDYGDLWKQTFDPLGNLLSHVDASDRKTTYAYCFPDVPSAVTAPGGPTDRYEYDLAFRLVSHIDPLGHVRRSEYDAAGNLVAEVDPLGNRVAYEFDLEDNLVSVINEKGEKLEVHHDELSREIGTTCFDGRTIRYELDPLGRRTAILETPDLRTELDYQGKRDYQRQVFPDGAVESFELNENGQYVGITCIPPEGSTETTGRAEFSYSPLGRLSSESHNGLTLDYERDLCDRLVAIRDSLGDETRYVWGARNRVEQITDLGRTYGLAYLPTGEITEISYPNGLRQLFRYDGIGNMVARSMISATGQTLTWQQFTYDAADQLTSVNDWHWGELHYIYDACGRLEAVVAADRSVRERYRYDLTSNIIESPLVSRAVIDAGNRLEATADQRFEYDPRGNLVRRQTRGNEWTYEWDRDDQLARVRVNGTLVGEYEYDLVNRRRRKKVAGQTVDFLYDAYALRAEIFADETRNHYLCLPNYPVPIAQVRGQESYYYGYNQIGTPIEVFNEAGALVLAVSPQSFGAARQEYRPTNDSVDLPFGFMGQYHDPEIGLFYNHFRYYDAVLGRYISQDPLRLRAGMNFYAFSTNPNNVVDPLGLLTFECLPHWGACQQWYARQKVKAINEASKSRRKKTCTKCRDDEQRDDWDKKCGGDERPSGYQVDHFYELQAGGADHCCNNLRLVEGTFNNDLGHQVTKMMKGVNVGTVLSKIATKGCTTRGQCSEQGKKDVAKEPGVMDDCPPAEDVPVPPPPC
jgi:RHS repeat-associated protein